MVTMTYVAQDHQVEHLVETLRCEFGGTVPSDRITIEARRAHSELVRTSRVPGFIAILALRRARAALAADQTPGTDRGGQPTPAGGHPIAPNLTIERTP